MKPTKGPWDWACDSYGKVRHSRKYDCVFSGLDDGPLITVASRIANPADARLIAAAPDLYQALRNTCDLGTAGILDRGIPCDCDPCQFRRAAIAKAEGREQPA